MTELLPALRCHSEREKVVARKVEDLERYLRQQLDNAILGLALEEAVASGVIRLAGTLVLQPPAGVESSTAA